VSGREPWALYATAATTSARKRERIHRLLAAEPELAARSIVLATCHRVEAFGFGRRPALALPSAAGFDAAYRLARIATGLESAALGEDEVLHQVREALREARPRLLDQRVARLFESAIAAGRRARSAGKPRSRTLEERALDWLAAAGGQRRRLLVVGRGRMGSRLARRANERGWGVTVATRRPEAGQLGLAEAAATAGEYDAVAVALAGVWAADPRSLPPVADLSSPPALPVPPERYLGIDSLFASLGDDPAYRERAERLAAEVAAEFMARLDNRQEVPA
jgi:glutamyl-tRNA reductase